MIGITVEYGAKLLALENMCLIKCNHPEPESQKDIETLWQICIEDEATLKCAENEALYWKLELETDPDHANELLQADGFYVEGTL